MGYAHRQIPEYMSSTLFALILCFAFSFPSVHSQTPPTTPSTTTLIPQLQWINLTGLLGGANGPPPLKGASIGYDDNSRNLLIFGGESQEGFAVSQTYLLNLDTLTWHQPAPPLNLQGDPPARSFAVSGDDSAASNRHSHIVIGGKSQDGKPLADVWEFDYTSQFWSQVQLTSGGPSARWGAVGGIDTRTPPVQDPVLPGPNNTFYLAGGFDGSNAVPVSDLWRLNISGTLSSNNPTSVVGSWEQISITNGLPGRTGIGGSVVWEQSDTQQRLIALGGCATSQTPNDSCLDGNDYIVDADTGSDSIPPSCPAPRLQPAVAANFNSASTSFASQVFMLLGTFNSSLWNDGGGLQKGEVDVLDISTRGWARVLPAGDPGTSGKPTFPSPRAGATALSWPQALVGSNRAQSSDVIVFGGEDESGNYLADVWVLRAYNPSANSNGALQGGVNASGAGVSIQKLSTCATAVAQPTASGSSSSASSGSSSTSAPGPSDTNSPKPPSNAAQSLFDTSVTHKALAPVSIALLLPAILAFRLSSPSALSPVTPDHRMALFYLSVLTSLVAFGVGVGGLASAFTSIKSTASLAKRSSLSMTLTTSHGKAGLALFIGLFGAVPLLLIASAWTRHGSDASTVKGRYRASSGELMEKAELYPGRMASPQPTTNEMPEETVLEEPRPRSRSWNSLSPWPANRNARVSSESGLDAASSPSTVRSFEVTNRATARARHTSAHSLAAFGDPRPSHAARKLSDMSWLERRRGLNSVGDLDYALAQFPRRIDMPPTPGTAAMDIPSTRGLVGPPSLTPRMPDSLEFLIHVLLHAFLLGLCILSLVALWLRAPKGAFAAFFAWVVIFYALIIYLASRGAPQESVLSTVINRISTDHTPVPATPTPSRPLSDIGVDSVPFPTSGPYAHHQPPFRIAHESEYPTSTNGHGSAEAEEDDGLDEDTRQRAIEEEMNRRDVSIVTVPKRKLFLTNPELS